MTKLRRQNEKLNYGIQMGEEADEYGINTRTELGRHTELIRTNRKRVGQNLDLEKTHPYLVEGDTWRTDSSQQYDRHHEPTHHSEQADSLFCPAVLCHRISHHCICEDQAIYGVVRRERRNTNT